MVMTSVSITGDRQGKTDSRCQGNEQTDKSSASHETQGNDQGNRSGRVGQCAAMDVESRAGHGIL